MSDFPPQEVLTSIPVAPVEDIAYRKLEFFNYTTKKQPKNFDLKSIPFKFHLDDLNSQFIRYYMFLNLSSISQEDRPWMVLLTETWLQSPIEIDGKTISLADVVKMRSKEALTFYNDLGYKGSTFTPGAQSENIMFYTESMMDKYEEGLKLLKDALFNVKFTKERTQTILTMLLNSLPNAKLSAASILKVMSDNLYFNNETLLHHASFLRQNKFLDKVQMQLNDDPKPVLQKLQSLAKQIFQPKNAFVYMATDLDRLTKEYKKDAAGFWKDFFPHDLEFYTVESLSERIDTPSENQFVNHDPERRRHAIAGIPGTVTSYIRQHIPFDIKDWEDDDVAATRVMLQYLSDQMYNLIRGKGLTYSTSMSSSVTEGRLTMVFSRSSQPAKSYAVFR